MILKSGHQTLVVLVVTGIVASSSTASSFGSLSPNLSLNSMHKKAFVQSGSLFFRGGSDEEGVPELTSGTKLTATTEPMEEPEDSLDTSSGLSSVEETSSETSTTAVNTMGPKSSPPGFLRRLFPSFPWHTLPNLLTYARCIAIPGLMFQFYMSKDAKKNLISSLIFAIASITDYLDGFLARRWDICSPFGAFLDPVADKLMVSTALILLTGKYGAIVAIPSAIILAREISVSALREWMASKGKRDSVKVGFQGKCKTAFTMLSLTIILAVPDGWTTANFGLSCSVMNIGMIMLYLSALVTVTSGSVYFKAAAPVLLGKED